MTAVASPSAVWVRLKLASATVTDASSEVSKEAPVRHTDANSSVAKLTEGRAALGGYPPRATHRSGRAHISVPGSSTDRFAIRDGPGSDPPSYGDMGSEPLHHSSPYNG